VTLSVEEVPGGVRAAFKVLAGSSRTEIRGTTGSAVRIAVAAEAEKNKANEALIAFLAKSLSVSASSFRIISGRTSPLKRVFCPVTRDRFLSVFVPAGD
jgi:uncharacterized protein YggU (UPF0235/DUF167 family)